MNTKIILIARVSDVEQRKALPAQKLRLEKYAKQKKLEYEYYEFDESAHKDERKKFSELVEHIKQAKTLCYVVFDKIDRFTRDSSQEEVKALQQLVKAGKIELHFPHDSLYINQGSSASDWFRLGIGMALAKYYSDSIRDNVKRRFDQMLEDGIWVHRAPIGYKNINKGTEKKPDKDIVVDETRAHYIVRAFEMRALGTSYEVIASALVEDGFTSTRSGSKPPNKTFLERILKNKFYYGVMTHSGKEYPHKYERLIDRALFDKCQRVREKRRNDRTKYDSVDYTFKKIAKCGRCGRTASTFTSRNTEYMRCTGYKACGNPNTAVAAVIEPVDSDIGYIDVPESLVDKVVDELKKRHDDQQLYFTQNIETTRREYDEIDKKLKKMYFDLLDGRITQTFYDEIAKDLEAKRHRLNERLKLLTNGNTGFKVTTSYLLDLAQRAEQLFQESDPSLRNKLLEYVLTNIELDDKKLSYELRDPFKSIVEAKKKAPSGLNSNIWCG